VEESVLSFPIIRLLVAVSIATFAALNASVAQEAAGARQMFDGAMLPGIEIKTMENSENLFPTRTVEHKGKVRELPPAQATLNNVNFKSAGKRYDLFDYLALNRVAGLLILKNGTVVREDYELGIGPQTRWPSFSMGKSLVSTLIGAALQDGSIFSLDDPVSKYVPSLKTGAYEHVTVRNLIQMASGVKWDETYTDPKSDRRKVLDLQLQFKPGQILPYMNALPRAGAPGTIWNYNTGDTFVVGAILEGATKKPLATYLAEKIWSRWGMESDAKWWLESPNGMGLGGGGIEATMRDFGRVGLLVLADGVIDGQRVVPEGWFAEAASAKIIGGKSVDYGYLWWTFPKTEAIHAGAFQAIGIFGQHLYINKKENLVIVVLSARPKPTGSTVIDDADFFAAVANALR
jgi:CubicO group peptidase (beta-lactamase class C family)